jgi:thermitase
LPASNTPPADSTPATGVVLLEVEPNAAAQVAADVAEVLDVADAQLRMVDPALGLVSVQAPSTEIDELEGQLAALPAVAAAEVAEPMLLFRMPDDPRLPDQLADLRRVRLPAAWRVTTGSRDVRVAVIDTGVAVGHPDLAASVVATANAVTGGTNVTDNLGHGTAVAGVVAAVTNNGVGMAGAGWRTSLIAIKVADEDGYIYPDAAAVGVRRAVALGADVVNLSLGAARRYPVLDRAIADAQAAGVLVVASAGNEARNGNPTIYPAATPGVVAVGAVGNGGRAAFSSYGRWVDVAAPGVGILSTVPNGYRRVDGTSFAAPLVAAQAALLKAARPSVGPNALRRAIVRSARPAGGGIGAGVVDARESLRWVLPTPPQRPDRVRLLPRSRRVIVRWTPPSVTYGAPVTRYVVQARRGTRPWREVATVGAARRGLVVQAKPRTRVRARVAAVTAYGRGAATTTRWVRVRR